MGDGINIFDGPIGKRIELDLLSRTVEGRESSLSYVLAEGVPAMSANGVPLGSPANAQLLIDYLRSDRPLDREHRTWLADLLDPKRPTKVNLSLSRGKGKPKSDMLKYVEAVGAYIDQREAGDGYDAAVAHVSAVMQIKKGTLRKAIARLEEGINIHRETQRNP